MASQAGGLIQDQNLSVHSTGASVVGKTNAFKAQRKGGLGGRKPLGDLSNSAKPSSNQASKMPISKNFSIIEEETGASKAAYDIRKPLGDLSNSAKPSSNHASKRFNPKNFSFIEEKPVASKATYDVSQKKSISKAQEKVQTRGRKALTDISNSGKPHLHQAPKKYHNMKLSVLAQEQIHPNAIAEEQFLHNHQECIKAQTKAMDMDYFLKTVGLDNDFAKQSASQWAPPVSSKLKPESPLKYLELEEMVEQWIGDRYLQKHELSSNLGSPPCRTPKSPNQYVHWKDHDHMNFMLMETPELPKH